jgi:hypothetical protein
MTIKKTSLLAGRNQAPLSSEDTRRATNTFLGLDQYVNVRYEEAARTVFRVERGESGEEYGEIVFGPDIYPGRSVVDPIRLSAYKRLRHTNSLTTIDGEIRPSFRTVRWSI